MSEKLTGEQINWSLFCADLQVICIKAQRFSRDVYNNLTRYKTTFGFYVIEHSCAH